MAAQRGREVQTGAAAKPVHRHGLAALQWRTPAWKGAAGQSYRRADAAGIPKVRFSLQVGSVLADLRGGRHSTSSPTGQAHEHLVGSRAANLDGFQRWLQGITGVVFIGFGARLATYRA